MIQRQRLLKIVYALIGIVAVGVIGYMLIEGWSFLDALYMTIITISTVGYQEVCPAVDSKQDIQCRPHRRRRRRDALYTDYHRPVPA